MWVLEKANARLGVEYVTIASQTDFTFGIVSIIIFVRLYCINERCLFGLRYLPPKDLSKWLSNIQRNMKLITLTPKPRFLPGFGWGVGRIITSGSWMGASAWLYPGC